MKKFLFALLLLSFLSLIIFLQKPQEAQVEQKAQEMPIPKGEYFRFEITTKAKGQTFAIPTGGYIGGHSDTNKTYNWNIDWGDGSEIENANGTQSKNGIPHKYADAGKYIITITPAGSNEAWLAAFGFAESKILVSWALYTYVGGAPGFSSRYKDNNIGANKTTNKEMVTKIISPLTPLMTRTYAQISGEEPPPREEWAYTFYECVNLTMDDKFTFSDEWNNIKNVGPYFAAYMFYNCSGYNFTMSPVFNLPQGIIIAGVDFAEYMFAGCHGNNFNMSPVFNLPQNITEAKWGFAERMFAGCYGSSFTMNQIFNLPQGITTTSQSFANSMFSYCSGSSFTMNSVFNLPQNVTEVDEWFAVGMFQNSYGSSFMVNDVFKFPLLPQSEFDKFGVFDRVFYGINNNAPVQKRTALSIINGNPLPKHFRETFSKNTVFSDVSEIDKNWRSGK